MIRTESDGRGGADERGKTRGEEGRAPARAWNAQFQHGEPGRTRTAPTNPEGSVAAGAVTAEADANEMAGLSGGLGGRTRSVPPYSPVSSATPADRIQWGLGVSTVPLSRRASAPALAETRCVEGTPLVGSAAATRAGLDDGRGAFSAHAPPAGSAQGGRIIPASALVEIVRREGRVLFLVGLPKGGRSTKAPAGVKGGNARDGRAPRGLVRTVLIGAYRVAGAGGLDVGDGARPALYLRSCDTAEGAELVFETKDYFTIGIASVALVFSGCAVAISVLSYKLAVRRDQREVDAKKPLLDFDVPPCDGIGDWPIKVTFVNRDDVPVVIERLYSDRNRAVELVRSDTYPVPLARMMDPNALNYADMQMRLNARESREVGFVIGSLGKRIPTATTAVFDVTYRRVGDEASSARLSAAILLNP